ncbi:hypothetical protein V5799_033333 [Amblyomma americanum]|uniref:Uncharacterized protein n=1 Tax=Amblyomma americanum TaxID=6943 RepID=A0AAQ4DNL6_AMBAM
MPRKQCGSLKRKQKKINQKKNSQQLPLSPAQEKEISASETWDEIVDSSTSSVSEESASDSSARPQPAGETSLLPEKQLSTSVAIQASPHDGLNSALENMDDAYSTADEEDGFQVYYSKKRRAYFYNGGHNKMGPVGKVVIISPKTA